MQYWVYGSDRTSGEPCDPLFIEAKSEADAMAQAKESGMVVEAVEPVEAKSSTRSSGASPIAAMLRVGDVPANHHPSAADDPEDTDHPMAAFLVVAFRVMAGICAVLYFVIFLMILEAPAEFKAVSLGLDIPFQVGAIAVVAQGIVVVAFLLATAEFLRMGIALERNTRKMNADTRLPESK